MIPAPPAIHVVPFEADHLEASDAVLAGRHASAVAAEPLLPAGFAEPAAALRLVSAAWSGGARGAVGLQGDHLVGFLLGAPSVDAVRGPGAWSRDGRHAVASDDLPDSAELYRDLYVAASPRGSRRAASTTSS